MDIRSGLYIEDERLEAYAASTAKLLPAAGDCGGRESLRRLRRSMLLIRRTHEAVRRRYEDQTKVPAACEWLLDNWYMAQREYVCAAQALREARYLRRCREGVLIVELCRALLRAGQGRVTEERSRLFLGGFQTVTALRRSELSLFPAALRTAALEELAGICRQLQYAADVEQYTAALEALFGTLRLFSVLDTEKLLRSADLSHAILCADPSGDYPRMDGDSQRDYLRRLEKLARRQGLEEQVCARALIQEAKAEGRHVGQALYPEPDARRGGLYITANVLLTLFFSLLPAFALQSASAALLLLLPVSQLVKGLLDAALLRLVKPRRLPRLDLSEGVPAEGKTICVVSLLLTGGERAESLAGRLEELRLACRSEGRNLSFGLLADLPGAKTENCEEDAALLQSAETAVNSLNRKYGGGFYLFTRPRRFDGEGWSAPERKRGALLELARLLCDEPSALRVTGERDALRGTRYILTLDSDTRLYPGAAGELIGAMLHPLCKARVDPERGVVTRGHGVLQPRLSTELGSANATDFSLIFAGPGGSDPYGALSGELYSDAFGSTGFAGKGLLDARALLQCTGTLPEGRILSHDALEGAFLRGGFLGDAEFSDAFPVYPLSYYKRLHRWVRGDWQNLSWVFCRRISPMDRWRLFDSLRRSLIAPMTLLAILAGFFLPQSGGPVLAAAAALLALSQQLLLALARCCVRRRSGLRPRHYTRLLTGVGGLLVQSFLRLWLLPYEAWICASALCTALWRMAVSGKKLLQWQTAAQAEQGGRGLAAHLRAMLPCALLGLALLRFSPVIMGKSAGLLWLLSPLMTAALALPARQEERLSASDRAYLLEAARRSWAYFTENVTAADHHLPPDNVQLQPPVGAAHRTSPTNMGLALLSAAAACALGFAEKNQAAAAIEETVETLERLPRYQGHFYNWYDTRTLKPLQPPFVSTVDSGNLCACLLCVCAALEEFGEKDLAERTAALLAPMDFSALYDFERNLFYICLDPETGRGAGGWYDLLASEAMLTSYLAVAKGQVPRRHWRRLSRAQLQKDGYRGLASWTGTMFEYLMPALFLPYYRGSLLYESGRFCLYAQKRRVFPGRPWGISESAFYSLDPERSYRYKANGVAALALKRGQDADLVVAPYASFLALALDPQGAVNNLRRLARFGGSCRLGYWEALDFSPSRCQSDRGEKVCCVMAHHTGMSILAAANALCDDVVRRWFFADPAMRAYRLLLQERIDDAGAVIRRDRAEPRTERSRVPAGRWQRQGGAPARPPVCAALSNGAYHLLVESGGQSRALCEGWTVYGEETLPWEGEGLSLSLRLQGERCALVPGADAAWEFQEEQARWDTELGPLHAAVSVCAAAGELGELRRVELHAAEDLETQVTLDLRPVLAPWADFSSHPAYWRLGLECETEEGAILLHRLRRGDLPERWLCLRCDARAIARADLRLPQLSLDCALSLRRGQSVELSFALCLGLSLSAALEGAGRILREKQPGNMVTASALHLGLGPAEIGGAMDLIAPLLAPVTEAPPRRELWQYGVSGDLPILCCDGKAVEAPLLLRQMLLLKSCGVDADLVLLSDEQGEYRQPLRRRFQEILSPLGLEPLIGSRGGVHFLPRTAAAAVEKRAAVCIARPPRRYAPLRTPSLSTARRDGAVPAHAFAGEEFRFAVEDSLPERAWQQILSNGRLGCVAADCGVLSLWQENAREMRLLRPREDARTVRGALQLWADTGSARFSLFAANDWQPCRICFGPGWAAWRKELEDRSVSTTLFIPPETDALVLLIEGAAGLSLRLGLEPLLGAADASALRCSFSDGLYTAENPEAYLPGLRFLAACSGYCSARLDYTPPALLLSLVGEECTVLACGCCTEEELRALCEPGAARAALEQTKAYWTGRLSRFSLRGTVPALEHLVNTWAPYQALACRLLGRSSLYQSGGAFGFRDQLQDAVNLLLLEPDLARERILDCCRHQYVEGDVMHWWHVHPDGDKGIRSRCGDDLLWLPWALCEYVEATGDSALCQREEPYCSSPPLSEGERDRYETPERDAGSASVLFHAKAALDCAMGRGLGKHGLPFFGSGDWNDGLDAVDGESVWLGWFASVCAGRFARLLEALKKPGAARYRDWERRLGTAANAAWNGRWYERGYWADGTPLGGERRIDALPQAWAALSPWADSTRVAQALDEALSRLVDEENRLVKLFDPPYRHDERYPGYLAGYGRGFRENGGQYTHAALWLVQGLLARDRAEDAWRLLQLLIPEGRDLRRYEAEPFVLPADVSAAAGREGEAGWTWYTGSAGWFYRIVTRELLGLRLREGRLHVEPRLPAALPGYEAEWTDPAGERHRIRVRPGEIRLDGKSQNGEGSE